VKRLLNFAGLLFIISSILFLIVYSLIVTVNSNEDFARDLFGFPISHPPLWTSYVPYLGSYLGFIFEFFSIHGLISVIISVSLFGVGLFLLNLSEKKNNKQREIEEIITNPNLPDVIKQEFINRDK